MTAQSDRDLAEKIARIYRDGEHLAQRGIPDMLAEHREQEVLRGLDYALCVVAGRRMPGRMPGYIAAQCVGAFLASGTLHALFPADRAPWCPEIF